MIELRNEPVQERSRARVAQIIAAARVVYDRVGQDAFNTNLVAEEAGASIGTVYRYFPDRVPLMDIIDPDRNNGFKKIAQIEAALRDISEQNPRARVRNAIAIIEAPYSETDVV
jgi:AcrR family transcriptional regulator